MWLDNASRHSIRLRNVRHIKLRAVAGVEQPQSWMLTITATQEQLHPELITHHPAPLIPAAYL